MKNLIFLLTLSISFNTFAFDFNSEQAKNIFDKAKGTVGKAIDAASKLPRPTLPTPEVVKTPTTNNSRYIVSDTVSSNAQWVMIRITKSGETETEVVLTPAKNGRFSEIISLRSGAGTYSLGIFENTTTEKYTSYTGVKNLSVNNLDTRDTNFLLPSQLVQADDATISSMAQMITEGSADEAEAIKRIHDFITENIKYDYDSFNDGSYVNKPYDALTVLQTKKTVCAGYSDLLAALARAVGIRAKVIYGQATFNGGWADHAWNEVMIDNEWKIIDSTWDAAAPKDYKYFFPTKEEFARDHQSGAAQVSM